MVRFLSPKQKEKEQATSTLPSVALQALRQASGQAPSTSSPENTQGQAGQALAEFALVLPILVLLFFGLAFAAWYAFRATSADWAVFISGVARGSYNTPASADASILWSDLRSSVSTGTNMEDRQVNSRLGFNQEQNWLYGIGLQEVHQARTNFRLWRFYPGPPSGEWD